MSIEILAPAGNMESVVSAVRCKADAVYLGGANFSARQNAANFNDKELKEAIDYCHLNGVSVHQAINTIVFDSQLSQLKETVIKSAQAGVDAFIIQDLGVLRLVKAILPDMPCHASTQMTIHTKEGALLAKELGFSRVVAAREHSKEQLAELCNAGIEIEAFVHGALCMSVSGQCYMSAMIGSRSANRGLCAQACRLPFSASDCGEEFALSLKDMSLVKYIKELSEIGIASLKIEGRMKRPEYVAAAVDACRKAADGDIPDLKTLQAVFSRSGFTDGYFENRLGGAMFGVRGRDDVVSANDVLPTLRDLYKKENKCTAVYFTIDMKKNMPVKLTATDSEGNSVQFTGDIPPAAINRPTDMEQAGKQLSKLGDTVYEYGGTCGEIDEGIMLPASSLNNIRREAVEELNKKRISSNTKTHIFGDLDLNFTKTLNIKPIGFRLQLHKAKQQDGIDLSDVEMVSLPVKECLKSDRITDKTAAVPPRFMPGNENEVRDDLNELRDRGVSHLLCGNLAHIKIGRELGYTLHGDYGLNVTNTLAVEQLAQMGLSDVTASFEMKLSQLARLGDVLPYGIIAYGRLPLMLTRNCPIKSSVGCQKCRGDIRDRTGRNFPVACNDNYTEILNSEVLSMSDRMSEINGVSFVSLKFYDEAPEQINRILNCFKSGKQALSNGFTRGLYYRGIQ